jgi:hypothetical protein
MASEWALSRDGAVARALRNDIGRTREILGTNVFYLSRLADLGGAHRAVPIDD